jgi:hypothetical protein
MSFSDLNDESLERFYEGIRREVDADRVSAKTGHFFAVNDSVKKYASALREEMTRRRLRFTPIDWWYERHH